MIPPGDDMGAITIGGQTVLVAVDQLADQVHFDSTTASLNQVARKAVTRNLSDIAAMAALPVGMVAAAALPRDFGQDKANKLFNAMRKVAEQFNCPLFGGDISIWDQRLMLTVTVLAEPAGIEPILRTGAQVGDAICVTGALGGSLITLDGYTHHLDFQPRITAARALAEHHRPHCMIDLSDGLAKDIGHIGRAANLGVVIDADKLPISPAAQQAVTQSGKPAWQHAIGDGEDYELCFTMPPEQVPSQIEDVPITPIGQIVETPQLNVRLPDGTLQSLADFGWEHTGS